MQTAPLTSYPDFPSTYAVLIAESLLKRIGITLSKASIKQQLQDPQSFHKQLLRALAIDPAQQFRFEQAGELDHYIQGEMTKLGDAHKSVKAAEDSTVVSPTEAESDFQSQFLKLQREAQTQSRRLTTLAAGLQAFEQQVQEDMGRFINGWQTTQTTHVNLIKDRLSHQGVILDEGQTKRLSLALTLQSIDPPVPADLMAGLKLSPEADPVAQVVVRILLDAGYEIKAIKAMMGKLEPDLLGIQKTNQDYLGVFAKDINGMQGHARESEKAVITLIDEMNTTAQTIAYTINHMPNQWRQALPGHPAVLPVITIGEGDEVTPSKRPRS